MLIVIWIILSLKDMSCNTSFTKICIVETEVESETVHLEIVDEAIIYNCHTILWWLAFYIKAH